jgi:hypothetical protein
MYIYYYSYTINYFDQIHILLSFRLYFGFMDSEWMNEWMNVKYEYEAKFWGLHMSENLKWEVNIKNYICNWVKVSM